MDNLLVEEKNQWSALQGYIFFFNLLLILSMIFLMIFYFKSRLFILFLFHFFSHIYGMNVILKIIKDCIFMATIFSFKIFIDFTKTSKQLIKKILIIFYKISIFNKKKNLTRSK